MKRKAPYPLEKVTINLREGDAEFLSIVHPQLGYGLAIRMLIASYVDKVKEKTEAAIKPEVLGELAMEAKE